MSVKITDALMAALQSEPDRPHVVANPRTGRRYFLPRTLELGRYGLQDLWPEGHAAGPCYAVQDVWQAIVTNAHATGEPGVCFIDRVNRDNPTPAIGRIEAANPCGEQPLLDEEACCLGSIDVSKLVLPDRADLDWDALAHAVELGVHLLDNVIDASCYPARRIEQATLASRKIGLGVMGSADALVMMGTGARGQCRVEDSQPAGPRICSRRRQGPPTGLQAWLQGHDRIPGRLPTRPGALGAGDRRGRRWRRPGCVP